tara:strand:+ start:777 stop:884 length:108 start_codon:yes stop_codon:yes gene_type:complete
MTVGIRIDNNDEVLGVDKIEHNEVAYCCEIVYKTQ